MYIIYHLRICLNQIKIYNNYNNNYNYNKIYIVNFIVFFFIYLFNGMYNLNQNVMLHYKPPLIHVLTQ